MGTEPIINLRGEKVGIGPLDRANLAAVTRWMNDFEVTRTLLHGNKPVSLEQEAKWFDRVFGLTDSATFHIWELATGRLIGNCGLHEIDERTGTALFGLVIGEKDCWGKGYGTETCKLVLRYAFEGRGLHNVMLTAFGNNPAALKAYQRAGFKELGRRRQALRWGQERVDEVYFDILASDFRR